jgi:hypothetical protein
MSIGRNIIPTLVTHIRHWLDMALGVTASAMVAAVMGSSAHHIFTFDSHTSARTLASARQSRQLSKAQAIHFKAAAQARGGQWPLLLLLLLRLLLLCRNGALLSSHMRHATSGLSPNSMCPGWPPSAAAARRRGRTPPSSCGCLEEAPLDLDQSIESPISNRKSISGGASARQWRRA